MVTNDIGGGRIAFYLCTSHIAYKCLLRNAACSFNAIIMTGSSSGKMGDGKKKKYSLACNEVIACFKLLVDGK